MTAHQAWIRQREAARLHVEPVADLKYAFVRSITRAQAKPIILAYEWLGTLGRATACYGLFSGRRDVANLPAYCNVDGEELIGVACFGRPAGTRAGDICGREYRRFAIALERGACVHWAPRNAASYLITHAVRAAHRDHGWSIFYAYADPSAGEIGTVYQACNWTYLGQGVGRAPGRTRENVVLPDGRVEHDRALTRHGITKTEAQILGWRIIETEARHKYVTLVGDRRSRGRLRQALRYPALPYPKRPDHGAPTATNIGTHPPTPNAAIWPAESVPINSRCDLLVARGETAVRIGNRIDSRFPTGDRRARSLALVRLVKQGYATQAEVARALGLTRQMLRRHTRIYDREGPKQLGRTRGYPRGRERNPDKKRIDREILQLLKGGWSRRKIADRLGITEAAVRKRLRRLPPIG